MRVDIEKIKLEVAKVAEKHDLKLMVLYGSQATGKAKEKSDIDIAVLGKKSISYEYFSNGRS